MPKVINKKEKKSAYYARLQDVCTKYNKALFVDVDNVTSKQICVIRADLRKIGGYMIMGKNVSKGVSLSQNNLIILIFCIDSHEVIYYRFDD